MTHERFVSGQYTTGFISEEFPNGYAGHELAAVERFDLLACVAALQQAAELRARSGAPQKSRPLVSVLPLRLRIDTDGEEEHVRGSITCAWPPIIRMPPSSPPSRLLL